MSIVQRHMPTSFNGKPTEGLIFTYEDTGDQPFTDNDLLRNYLGMTKYPAPIVTKPVTALVAVTQMEEN